MSRAHDLIALNAAEDLGRGTVCQLAPRLADWLEDTPDLESVGVGRAELERAREAVSRGRVVADRELRRAASIGARIVTLLDEDYPRPLRQLALPPPVLYYLGRPPRRPALAIVGARRASTYGREVAHLFARELTSAGMCVVSGFARGIDAEAHRGALAADGGATVAVLGCGLDVPYPTGRGGLRDEIAKRGALVSEFPFGTEPLPQNFPIRNRIIAALAAGTLVVQAEAKSGSLITARLALELGREIFAIPSRIFDRGACGPNTLIRDGAHLAQHPREIVECLPLEVRQRLEEPEVSSPPSDPDPPGPHGRLLAKLPRGRVCSPEQLAARVELPVDRVLGLLLELELSGRVRRYPGATFGRTPSLAEP